MGALIWKSVVVCITISLSLTSQSNADIERSANVLEELKIISETKTTNQSDLDTNVVPFSDVSAMNDDSTLELSKEKHITHFHYRNTESDEIQIVYWYYDKISAVILGIFFGIALDIENAKEILKQPIGPSIAVFCKFILSPFVSGISLEIVECSNIIVCLSTQKAVLQVWIPLTAGNSKSIRVDCNWNQFTGFRGHLLDRCTRREYRFVDCNDHHKYSFVLR